MKNITDFKNDYPDIPNEIWDMLLHMDAYTYNHSLRVCEICQLVEKKLNFPTKLLSEAGLLHDLGKYYYSQRVLGKTDSLNDLERDIVNLHSFVSFYILKNYDFPENVCDIVLHHHNNKPVYFKIVSSEYVSEENKRYANILKTIDIFEALTTDRPYHRGFSTKSAIDILKDIPDCDEEVIEILLNSTELERD